MQWRVHVSMPVAVVGTVVSNGGDGQCVWVGYRLRALAAKGVWYSMLQASRAAEGAPWKKTTGEEPPSDF